jgi:YD repeat-containing protein
LSYTYFPTGKVETIASSNPHGVSTAYTWDDQNRLSTVVDGNLSGQNTTTYTYDAGVPIDRSSSMGWDAASNLVTAGGWRQSR